MLKDIALTYEIPVVAIAAADKGSLVAKRMRVHDLRGSSALAYEADVVLILNDKYDVVARHHLVYHLDNERFRQWAVLTIEKNRGGIDKVEPGVPASSRAASSARAGSCRSSSSRSASSSTSTAPAACRGWRSAGLSMGTMRQ